MFDISKLNNKVLKCSKCGQEYEIPSKTDDKTGDKIYEYEIILPSTLQAECPNCKTSNTVNM